MNKKNIPNFLSVLRLISVPLFLIFYFLGETVTAIVIFAVSGITDVIDGYLARKNNWITDAGKILDPVADKLVSLSVLVALTFSKIIPFELLVVFTFKEIVTLIGFLCVFRKKAVITVSNVLGKLCTVSFYIIIGVIMLLNYLVNIVHAVDMPQQTYRIIVYVLCAISAIIALIATVQYIVKYKKYIIDKNMF